jgi:hypothetical protein
MSATRPNTTAPTAEASSVEEFSHDTWLVEVPLGLQQGHHDADDEQVVGVGREAHARDEHDLQLGLGDAGVIKCVERTRVSRRCC